MRDLRNGILGGFVLKIPEFLEETNSNSNRWILEELAMLKARECTIVAVLQVIDNG